MAFDGEDNSLEMIVLAPATYAIFKLKGPATAAVWKFSFCEETL